ncbi:MAG: DUF4831 family protein [Bacteroidales bacterium]
MKHVRVLLFVGLSFLLSCNNKSIQVVPVNSPDLKQNGIVYSLPRTVISLKIDVIQTITTPGPYAQYAQKYLGIEDVPTQKMEEYSIANISIDSRTETDPSAIYSAFLEDKSIFDFFQIVKSGLILPVGDFKTLSLTNSYLPKTERSQVNYTDLSTSPYIAEEKSTFYSKVQRDSSFVRVPIQKSMIIEKNTEEKAKEAAEFIFMLRKKRIEFMTIDVDNPLDGEAIKVMYAEIDKLENQYLLLFIGQTRTETISKVILYTPTKPEGESNIVFRYSSTKGIVSSTDLSGNPMLIEIEPEQIPESYSNYFSSMSIMADKNKFDQVYYRIPINASVKISDGKNELANRRLLIYQYGLTAKLPVKHLLVNPK